MAAKATRFCFRTDRTKPLRVSVSAGAAGEDEVCLKSAAIDGAVGEVELQRVVASNGCGRGCGRGRLRGRRASNWLMDGRWPASMERSSAVNNNRCRSTCHLATGGSEA